MKWTFNVLWTLDFRLMTSALLLLSSKHYELNINLLFLSMTLHYIIKQPKLFGFDFVILLILVDFVILLILVSWRQLECTN